jgi:hypothetical protein
MEASAEAVIRRIQANFPVRQAGGPTNRKSLPPNQACNLYVSACQKLRMIPLPVQEATSEASRQAISEEVLRYIKDGGGGEVRRVVSHISLFFTRRDSIRLSLEGAAQTQQQFSSRRRNKMQDQDISYLEDAIRNRLVSPAGTSGKAERLAAKKSLFSNDEWSRISRYMAFMEREDEKKRSAAAREHRQQVRGEMAGQAAEAAQRRCASGARVRMS